MQRDCQEKYLGRVTLSTQEFLGSIDPGIGRIPLRPCNDVIVTGRALSYRGGVPIGSAPWEKQNRQHQRGSLFRIFLALVYGDARTNSPSVMVPMLANPADLLLLSYGGCPSAHSIFFHVFLTAILNFPS